MKRIIGLNRPVKLGALLCAAASLLVTATAKADMSLPGYAGLADPISEGAFWLQNGSRLEFKFPSPDVVDTKWHAFTVVLPVRAFGGSLSVNWFHDTPQTPPLSLVCGEAKARVFTFASDGTQFDLSPFDATKGLTKTVTVSVPPKGSAILQINVKGDANGCNNHFFSQVMIGGTASP